MMIYFDEDQVRKQGEKKSHWHLMLGKWRKEEKSGEGIRGGVLIRRVQTVSRTQLAESPGAAQSLVHALGYATSPSCP